MIVHLLMSIDNQLISHFFFLSYICPYQILILGFFYLLPMAAQFPVVLVGVIQFKSIKREKSVILLPLFHM